MENRSRGGGRLRGGLGYGSEQVAGDLDAALVSKDRFVVVHCDRNIFTCIHQCLGQWYLPAESCWDNVLTAKRPVGRFSADSGLIQSAY
jgi:hypothetical protein